MWRPTLAGMDLDIELLSPGLGARLRGVDLCSGALPQSTAAQLMSVAAAYGGLLCVEAGCISRDDLVDFSRLFGELQQAPASGVAKAGVHPRLNTAVMSQQSVMTVLCSVRGR